MRESRQSIAIIARTLESHYREAHNSLTCQTIADRQTYRLKPIEGQMSHSLFAMKIIRHNSLAAAGFEPASPLRGEGF